MTTGLALLDPSVGGKGRILRRWNLRVNVRLDPAGRAVIGRARREASGIVLSPPQRYRAGPGGGMEARVYYLGPRRI